MKSFGLPLWCVMMLGIVAGMVRPACAQEPHIERSREFVRVELTPAKIAMNGIESRQQVLVTGYRRDGSVADLTDSARYAAPDAKVIRVDSTGSLHPKGDGNALLTVTAAGLMAQAPATVREFHKPFAWSFENHVEAVLSKQGCNMGICHGAAAGKGGFRLSLRAFDPAADYDRLRYEARGRRLTLTSPADSLLVRKPSLAIAHYGGLRLPKGSLEYRVVTEWIAAGAPGVSKKTPKIVGVEVFPRERSLLPKATQRLMVTARFSDGHTEDVTQWAKYNSNEETIAGVDTTGKVNMQTCGETAISIYYLGKVAFSRLSVPYPSQVAAARYASLPRANFIDDRIYAKLAPLHLWPSPLCTDAEFVRRSTLDTIGLLPTLSETRAFLADRSPDKRTKWIESLLSRKEFADSWTYRWCDLLRVSRDTLGEKGMWSFYNWLHAAVYDNRPWDQVVREIVTAQGTASSCGPVNFYRMGSKPEEFAENVSQAFLGIRVQCAHCHNHPFEKWTQNDYFRMANLFARIGKKEKGDAETIFAAASGDVSHPKLGKPLPPAAFDGPVMALDAPGDRRAFLADWMTSPQNPYFARSFVNRVWKRFMGRGLVEPVDDMRLTNPASNEPLLAALTQDFVAHHFDMKHLMRTILESRAYQLSSAPNETNGKDDRFYSRCLPRRLPGEALLDAICQVTEQPEKFADLPQGTRAQALPDTRIASEFLDAFGRPPRQVTCECERNAEPSVAQALNLINAKTLNQKIAAKGGLLDRLLDAKIPDATLLNELYLTCLCRPSSPAESKLVLHSLADALIKPVTPTVAPVSSGSGSLQPTVKQNPPDARALRKQVFGDLLWALMSGPEFQFNH